MSVTIRSQEARERPILFSGPMVRAILDGTKTQTRRVVKPQPAGAWAAPGKTMCPYGAPGDRLWVRETWCYATDSFACCVGAGYKADGATMIRSSLDASLIPEGALVFNGHSEKWPENVRSWRPSIHMPRWASRLTLQVTDVRVERLQDISMEGARAEGLGCVTKDGRLYKYGIADLDGLPGTDNTGWPWQEWDADPRVAYRKLWDSINAKRAPWESNPWVWVVSFEKVA